ncbi:MAG: endolytic transglycosylase MltG [Firmicutes bacterium]|nr:endolytic transglycosylase MltG [Bacillota bacterium]
MSSIMRGLGIGLFTAGILFTFISVPNSSDGSTTAPNGYELVKSEELKSLQEELSTSKEQLAQIQLDLEAMSKENNTDEQVEEVDDPSSDQVKTVLIIRSGMTSTDISSILEQTNIIKNRKDFDQYLEDKKLSEGIQIGTYELNSYMTIAEVANLITK